MSSARIGAPTGLVLIGWTLLGAGIGLAYGWPLALIVSGLWLILLGLTAAFVARGD